MSIKTQGAIVVSGLRKSYDHVVLDGVSLDIPAGSVFALLGPNGAGKTTTVNILTTLIPADAGEIVVAGHDLVREPHAVRAAIGVTGQFSAVDNLLTGEENLLLMADLHHLAPQESSKPDTRPAGAVRLDRCCAQVSRHILRRYAAAPGSGDGPDRRPSGPVPRRSRPPGWTLAAGVRSGRSSANWYPVA